MLLSHFYKYDAQYPHSPDRHVSEACRISEIPAKSRDETGPAREMVKYFSYLLSIGLMATAQLDT